MTGFGWDTASENNTLSIRVVVSVARVREKGPKP